MAFNSNGQVQYLILDSLADGSKYGLEIIEFIAKKTNGGYILKKPTLYSCLTRLEKKGLVSSSFWGESEFGGKRHYYALTDEGKESLNLLAREFKNISFSADENKEVEFETNIETSESDFEHKPIFLEQKNLFDYAKQPKQEEKPVPKEDTPEVADNQIDFFSYEQPEKQESANKDVFSFEKEEPKKDDAKFLNENETLTPYQIEQNKKLYDTSSELKKYRNRKSFSDNQIEMSVVYEQKPNDEDFKSKIQSLKESILQTKQNNFDRSVYANLFNKKEETENSVNKDDGIYLKPQQNETPFTQTNKVSTPIFEDKKQIVEEKDDAVLITEPKIADEHIPYQRKITPPNIEINVSDDNLPAPIRDSNLEPTYTDMMSKINEKKKEKEIASRQIQSSPNVEQKATYYAQKAQPVVSFADFESLKGYYHERGIEFKEYKRTYVQRVHNTNLLNLIISVILFGLVGVGCAIFYGIISGTNHLMASSNFLFYTIPALFLIYVIISLIQYKCTVSRKATQRYNAITNWAVFILASVIVFVINICCGMQAETMIDYLTSILVPIYALLVILPINYYLTKFVYKKYAK